MAKQTSMSWQALYLIVFFLAFFLSTMMQSNILFQEIKSLRDDLDITISGGASPLGRVLSTARNYPPPPRMRSAVQSSAADNNSNLLLEELREAYLQNIMVALMGGLTHASAYDVKLQSNLVPAISNQCLTRDWTTGAPRDFCIVKWDGYERLMRLQDLYLKIVQDGVEGDLMECGVWRGGMTILMRALLKAYNDDSRRVIVSDSFQGMPDAAPMDGVEERIQKMDAEQWGKRIVERAADGSGKMVEKRALTVEENLVLDNFRRFNLADDKVVLVPGWFNEALPTAAAKYGIQKLALLRIDGDMYSSTMDVLVNMYPLVSSGGYIIFDDYNIEQSRLAVKDFFAKEGLDMSLIQRDRITGPRHVTKKDHKPSHKDNEEDGAYFRKP